MEKDYNSPGLSATGAAACHSQEKRGGAAETLIRLAAEEGGCLEAILKVLHDKEGVDFSHYRQSTVLRRIVRRMALGKKSSFDEYLHQLQTDRRELDLLHGDLLLYFAEFFRDPQIFETLNAEIFPLLVENRTVKTPIRVWVPGCSTGEEVYSLAISLYEFLETNKLEVSAQFFGTDPVAGHIISARAASYPEKIARHVSPARLVRFFEKTGSGYRVIKRIREMCVFATQDITQDPPFADIDLLCCRNLLIYTDEKFQNTVIPLFHLALRPSGFLLLGTSETLGRFPQLFSQIDKRHNIFAKRGAARENQGDRRRDKELSELCRDPKAAEEYLQTIIAEKEEVNQALWTANEELIALNEELHLKNTDLTEANALNECTINCSMDGILAFDCGFRVRILNPAMERMWGMRREVCLDRSLFELFPFLVENGQQEVLLSVLGGNGAAVENQPYYNRERGIQGFFEARYSPLCDRNDRIIGGLAVIHDSTERRWAEEKLENEARLKMVMQQSPTAIEIYDLNGLLIGVNRAYEDLWRVAAATMVNSYNILETGEAERARLAPYVQRAYAGETVLVPEYRLGTAGGGRKDRWLSTRIYPLKDSGGKVKNIVVAVEDVTFRKRLEEDLMKIQRLESLGTLAGGIAHDFNNILMELFGSLTLVKNELPADHPAGEYLIDAQKSMNRATRLTQQLLIFAKGGNPVREGVSLDTLAEEVVRFDLAGSNVQPVFDIAPDLWLLEVDKGQIQQVFSNLTSNARQAMAEGGHLYVTMKNTMVAEGEIAELAAGNYVKVTVRDEGEGIEEKILGRIFDPYFTTRCLGQGLSLATTYSIMKKHGGRITVESAPAAGTVFTLYLPVTRMDLQPWTALPGEALDGAGKLRVLVVDDEEMICKVTSRFLELAGFLVTTAQDGQEAIESFRQAQEEDRPFAVVVMDLTIPGGMGGKEAVKEILALDVRAKVIVSSGYAEDPIMANYAAYGFCGIVAKPYSRDNLLAVVRQVLLGDIGGRQIH